MATIRRCRGRRAEDAPTVFLVAHMGFAARYLLRTDIFSTLKAAGVRIVILTPNAGEQYMVDEFANANVVLEPLRVDWNDFRLVQGSRLWSLLFYLRSYTIADGHRSEALGTSTASSHRCFVHRSPPAASPARSRPLPAVTAAAGGSPRRSAVLPRHAAHGDLVLTEPVRSSSPRAWLRTFPDAVVLREAAARGSYDSHRGAQLGQPRPARAFAEPNPT